MLVSYSRNMRINELIQRLRLPFRKEKELYSSLYQIIGFYPETLAYYKQALLHKSMRERNEKGRLVNNERLEFLGDAMLDAVVGYIVYRHYEGKGEGFLTNTRSKVVQRETLNRLAAEMGLTELIQQHSSNFSHNSYIGGNAFEALVGAIYLDKGYDACMRFMEQRVLNSFINLDHVAYQEVNFKSKLIEWSQKHRVNLEFRLVSQEKDKHGNPTFLTTVLLEGVEGESAKGFSKKESHQLAAKLTLQQLKKKPQFIDAVLAAKSERLNKARAQADEEARKKAEKEETANANAVAAKADSAQARRSLETEPTVSVVTDDDFDLSDIKHDFRQPSREDIIAAAEKAAFEGQE